MKKKLSSRPIWCLIIISLLFCFNFCTPSQKKHSEDTLYNSLIATKWKLRYYINDKVEYYIEFKDSLFIAQYFQGEDRSPKMYPGEWNVIEDTLFISDRRGSFNLLVKEFSDSTMVLQRSDSANLIFDIQPDGFYWE